jgi:hypothetical protein
MKKMVFIVLLAALNYSCGKEDFVRVKFDEKVFLEQKKLWQSSITKNYQYDLFTGGFLLYHGRITVENGDFVKEEIINEYTNISIPESYSTIDKIYDTIEETFNNNNGVKKSDFYIKEISVEYDRIHHIPTRIINHYYASPKLEVDGNFIFLITNFDRLQKWEPH